MLLFLVASVALLLVVVCASAHALKESECPVCFKVITEIKEVVAKAKKVENEAFIQETVRSWCKANKEPNNDRFCFYVGGLDMSATGILPMISTPMSRHLPVEKICERLKKADNAICELKYIKKAARVVDDNASSSSSSSGDDVRSDRKLRDLSEIDLMKLSVGDLRAILREWNEQCRGCTSKDDIAARVKELIPKHPGTKREL